MAGHITGSHKRTAASTILKVKMRSDALFPDLFSRREFIRQLEQAGAILVQTIQEMAFPKVAERLWGVQTCDNLSNTLNDFRALDRRLALEITPWLLECR